MYLIAGLGNPGDQYKFNRHNAGFLFLDYIKTKYNFNDFKKKKNFKYIITAYSGKEVVLIKPQTFMNLSGLAITSAMAFFKIKKEDIIVIFDDTALPFGKIRIRETGSDGGHNGLKNIQQQIGTTTYKRIRIGINAPEYSSGMISHVLGNFAENEIKLLNDELFKIIDESLKLIVKNNIKEAMNKYNGFNIEESKVNP